MRSGLERSRSGPTDMRSGLERSRSGLADMRSGLPEMRSGLSEERNDSETIEEFAARPSGRQDASKAVASSRRLRKCEAVPRSPGREAPAGRKGRTERPDGKAAQLGRAVTARASEQSRLSTADPLGCPRSSGRTRA